MLWAPSRTAAAVAAPRCRPRRAWLPVAAVKNPQSDVPSRQAVGHPASPASSSGQGAPVELHHRQWAQREGGIVRLAAAVQHHVAVAARGERPCVQPLAASRRQRGQPCPCPASALPTPRASAARTCRVDPFPAAAGSQGTHTQQQGPGTQHREACLRTAWAGRAPAPASVSGSDSGSS